MTHVHVAAERNSSNAMERMPNRVNKRIAACLFTAGWLVFFINAKAQVITDTFPRTGNLVRKDVRLDVLGRKMAEYNEGLAQRTQLVSGFRLLLMKTTDRDAVMKLRSTLLQEYPDQKNYLVFTAPYIQLKFGNFITRADAEKMRKELLDQQLVSGNVYILNEKVEQKPLDKNAAAGEE
jgi:hypothetical protein